MKKIIIGCLLMTTSHQPAFAGNEKIWASIQALEAQVLSLQAQIKAIPAGSSYSAGDGISITDGVISANYTKHSIGEVYQGGIIFWLDETGEHGLVASKKDVNQGAGVQWRNGDSGNKVTNARADGIGSGANNTALIIAQQTIDQQTGRFAALLAATYRISADGITPCKTPSANAICYGDWYLPSSYELDLIKHHLSLSGFAIFAPDYYWSSTEATVNTAWMQNFSTGEQVASSKSSTLGQVRAVRRF